MEIHPKGGNHKLLPKQPYGRPSFPQSQEATREQRLPQIGCPGHTKTRRARHAGKKANPAVLSPNETRCKPTGKPCGGRDCPFAGLPENTRSENERMAPWPGTRHGYALQFAGIGISAAGLLWPSQSSKRKPPCRYSKISTWLLTKPVAGSYANLNVLCIPSYSSCTI